MGNINNPCVNRWGLNSLWTRYWFSDQQYALFLQQDTVFMAVAKTFIGYGVEPEIYMYYNRYWYKPSFGPRPEYWGHPDYRYFTVVEDELGYTLRFRLRREMKETFQSRWVLLRFSGWYVIVVHWFQPDKEKNSRNRRTHNRPALLRGYHSSRAASRSTLMLSQTVSAVKSRLPSRSTTQPYYSF